MDDKPDKPKKCEQCGQPDDRLQRAKGKWACLECWRLLKEGRIR